MRTLNISMPEPMRDYVHAQAMQRRSSASEYVRELIRQDQQSREAEITAFLEKNHEPIAALLAISEKELDAGLGVEWDMHRFLADAEKQRK